MKTIFAAFFGAVLGCLAMLSMPMAQAGSGGNTVIDGDLTVNGSVKVKNETGSYVSIQANESIAGVWIQHSKKSPMVAIYEGSGQGAVIGIGGPTYGHAERGSQASGMDLAFAIQKDFEPTIQVNHGKDGYGMKDLTSLIPVNTKTPSEE